MRSRTFLLLLAVAAVIGGALSTLPRDAAVANTLAGNGRVAYSAFVPSSGIDFDVFTIGPDGANYSNLTASPGIDGGPAWSPDASKIAFHTNREEPDPQGCTVCDYEVYVMNADGSGAAPLTTDPARDQAPSWSPDGTLLAFQSNRDGNDEIYVMKADGSGQMDLTNDPATDTSPAWSPDGTRIAFESNRNGDSDVWVMNVDGSGPISLTTSPYTDSDPAWSPDSARIAFVNDGNVWAMNADGTGKTQLTATAESDDAPAWSPGGDKIAFARTFIFPPPYPISSATYLYVMNADGSDQHQLNTGSYFNGEPDWQALVPGDDTDQDGCTNKRESGSDPALGGRRIATTFWDFFDVPTPPSYTRDKAIAVGDIAAVVARFGSSQSPAPSKQEALAQALSPPPPPPAYHTAYDRTFFGPGSWNSGPPDGSITVSDIARIVAQFGHSCA